MVVGRHEDAISVAVTSMEIRKTWRRMQHQSLRDWIVYVLHVIRMLSTSFELVEFRI